MSLQSKKITEAELKTSLNELAHSVAREFALCARKTAIYGPRHPSVTKSLLKPFQILQTLFNYKQHVAFNLFQGDLYVLSFKLRESVFTKELITHMQLHDLALIRLERRVTADELGAFINRLSQRLTRQRHENLVSKFLRDRNMESIVANDEAALELFENGPRFRGDLDGDYSLKNIIMQMLPGDVAGIAELFAGKADQNTWLADFDQELVRYLIPEKIAGIAPKEFENALVNMIARDDDSESIPSELLDDVRAVYDLVDYHPDSNRIRDLLEPVVARKSVDREDNARATSEAGSIRIEAAGQIDHTLERFDSGELNASEAREFGDTFARLLRTGQRGKAVETVARLIDGIETEGAGKRQSALTLLLDAVHQMDLPTHRDLFEKTVDLAAKRIDQGGVAYEYSEFFRALIEQANAFSEYPTMARLVQVLAKRRKIIDDVTIYDSIAVKHALINVDRAEVVNNLIKQLVTADKKTASVVRDILVAIGSERVAMALSHIVTHNSRQVRQHSLKVLGELGKSSLKVFSGMLQRDDLFERDDERYELPDAKWYLVRNSIFVLGLLGDPEGVASLRRRIVDKDVRVRREIIAALEKIGGEDACDLLILMADDPDPEVSRLAVIGAGLIGNEEAVPMIFNVAERKAALSPNVVMALGKIGGADAGKILMRLLANEDELADLGKGQVSRDDLKLAVVKALGEIGDREAISQLRDYRDNLSRTQKIFFRNSAVNQEVDRILTRKKGR